MRPQKDTFQLSWSGLFLPSLSNQDEHMHKCFQADLWGQTSNQMIHTGNNYLSGPRCEVHGHWAALINWNLWVFQTLNYKKGKIIALLINKAREKACQEKRNQQWSECITTYLNSIYYHILLIMFYYSLRWPNQTSGKIHSTSVQEQNISILSKYLIYSTNMNKQKTWNQDVKLYIFLLLMSSLTER